jgi:YD repeat-containing protein
MLLRWGSGMIAVAVLLALGMDALGDERCNAYDRQGRLTSSSRSTGDQEGWTYDRADNRKTRTKSPPSGSCGAPTSFQNLVGPGIGQLIVVNPSRTIAQSSTVSFKMEELVDTNSSAATIDSFTPTSGCGTRTIAPGGQSVAYNTPSNIGENCAPGTPPPIHCSVPYQIRRTSTGTLVSGTASITIPGEKGPKICCFC